MSSLLQDKERNPCKCRHFCKMKSGVHVNVDIFARSSTRSFPSGTDIVQTRSHRTMWRRAMAGSDRPHKLYSMTSRLGSHRRCQSALGRTRRRRNSLSQPYACRQGTSYSYRRFPQSKICLPDSQGKRPLSQMCRGCRSHNSPPTGRRSPCGAIYCRRAGSFCSSSGASTMLLR